MSKSHKSETENCKSDKHEKRDKSPKKKSDKKKKCNPCDPCNGKECPIDPCSNVVATVTSTQITITGLNGRTAIINPNGTFGSFESLDENDESKFCTKSFAACNKLQFSSISAGSALIPISMIIQNSGGTFTALFAAEPPAGVPLTLNIIGCPAIIIPPLPTPVP